jgi:hypothetical protein
VDHLVAQEQAAQHQADLAQLELVAAVLEVLLHLVSYISFLDHFITHEYH